MHRGVACWPSPIALHALSNGSIPMAGVRAFLTQPEPLGRRKTSSSRPSGEGSDGPEAVSVRGSLPLGNVNLHHDPAWFTRPRRGAFLKRAETLRPGPRPGEGDGGPGGPEGPGLG